MRRVLLVLWLSASACSCAKKPEPVWAEVPLGGGNRHITALSVLAADDIWGVSRPDVFHWDGKQWSLVGSPGAEHLAAVAADDVWGVGRGGSWFHFDGKSWSSGRVEPVAAAYLDFWGLVAWKNEVWATAGIDGTYSHWNGVEWGEVKVPELAGWKLERISSIGAHVYVALMGKTKAAVGHFDGAKWEVLDERPGVRIRGSAPDDVWLVHTGAPRHFDGAAWTTTSLPNGAVAYDVFSRSKTEAYAVGKNGVALRWDGSQWSELPTGTRRDLLAVIGGATGSVWAAGADGVMLRYPR